jgi:hypothetical protein
MVKDLNDVVWDDCMVVSLKLHLVVRMFNRDNVGDLQPWKLSRR